MHTANVHSEDSDSDCTNPMPQLSPLSTDTASRRPTKKQKTMPRDEEWNQHYNALCQYAQMPMESDQDKDGNWNGNLLQKYITTDASALKLGYWVCRQRNAYKQKKLSQDRIDKLEELGLQWVASSGRKRDAGFFWEKNYNALCQYAQMPMEGDQDKDGNWNGNVPQKYITKDASALNLGIWVCHQRNAYKQKKLSQDRIDKLEELGLQWVASRGRRRGTEDSREAIGF